MEYLLYIKFYYQYYWKVYYRPEYAKYFHAFLHLICVITLLKSAFKGRENWSPENLSN